MNPRRGLWLVAIAVLVLSTTATATPTPDRVHFTAAGDYGQSPTTASVLQRIAAAGPDLNLALGDLSYGTTGAEQKWCDLVTSHVGAGFPFQLLSGNHESDGENGNINDFSACLPNQLPGAVGTYGRQYHVDVPQEQPLVRFIMISPGLVYPEGPTDYSPGSPAYEWTEEAIDAARARGIRWVVVGMHMPCLSLGRYGCASGTGVIDLLMQKKVDLVLSGHEHNYQRTKQLSLGVGCTSLTIDAFDADCVRDDDADLTAGAGTVFQTIGTGGVGLRDIMLGDPETGYFAARSGANLDPTFGVADFDVTPDVLSMRYLPVGDGTFTDAFTLTRPATPEPNEPPTAELTTTLDGLQASFDASASSDVDGAVVGHRWDFGDGSDGFGPQVQHVYASPGTYDVTLTVTDDDGATTSVVRPVTVEGEAPSQLHALDTFTRELATTWGTADTGGSWTLSRTSPVSGGSGHLLMGAAGAQTSAYLNSVQERDVDVTVDWSLDEAPTGAGAWAYQTVATRRTSAGLYKALVQVSSTGVVRATLRRNTGRDVVLGTGIQLPFRCLSGDVLRIRTQTTGVAPTTLRLKVWKKGTTEPSGWTMVRTDSTLALEAPGAVGLIARLSTDATNAPLRALVDDFRVQDPPAP